MFAAIQISRCRPCSWLSGMSMSVPSGLTMLTVCVVPLQLSRELQDIMKEQDPSLSADAVDDNVYQWDILLGGFAPTSPLGQARSSLV